MSPGSHLLIGWLVAAKPDFSRRERVLVSLSAVAPDIDGMGLIADVASPVFGGETDFFYSYHHLLGHNLLAALLISSLAALLASKKRLLVFALSFLCVHLHIICDVLGARGPDGYQWPIAYLYPLSSERTLVWAGQWELNAWQNQVIGVAIITLCVIVSGRKGVSPLEILSVRLDREAFRMAKKYLKYGKSGSDR